MIYELVNSSDDEVYHTIGFWLDKAEAIAAASVDSPAQLGMDVDAYASVEVREHRIGYTDGRSGKVVFSRKWTEQLNEPADEWEWTITETKVKP